MRYLDQRLVTQYAKFAALKNLLDRWLEEKREILLEALGAGAVCPERGPFLLVLEDAKDRVSWKEEFSAHLAGEGKSPEEIVAVFAAIEARPRETHPRLASKKNPNFRRKFAIKLPK
jgi:hypothetical protein